MNIDPRKSEYSLVSYSPVKHAENQALHKDELASLARSNRRKFFNFQCPIHSVTKHRTKDMQCVKCIDKKLHDAKLKEIVNKHCGVSA